MRVDIHARSMHPFAAVVEAVRTALAAEGFGILSEIDVQAKMKEKLGRDMPAYLILGACAPALAWDALQARPDVGVFLPCNVVVHEAEGAVWVRAMEPRVVIPLLEDSVVAKVAEEASARLKRVVDAVA